MAGIDSALAAPSRPPAGAAAVPRHGAVDTVPAAAVLRGRHLPAWPFTWLFLFYPLIWANGLAPFALPAVGAVCLCLLTARGKVRLPRLWGFWTAFLLWSATAVVMIDSGGRLVGFMQRWSSVVGASIVAVYVFNARESLPRPKVLRSMTWLFTWVVVGGYLGMLDPYGRLSTPILRLIPESIASNEYVLELLSPRFAEVQKPWGADQAFVRPSAPFPYTNGWGHAYVLLLPLVLAYAVGSGRRRIRVLVLLLVLASVPPALATLNRGIFIGVGVGVLYLAMRYVTRLSLARLGRLAVLGALAAVGVQMSGALSRITERTNTSSSTEDRFTIWREAYDRTMSSPLIGQGAPRPSGTLDVSVGTQGHFWYVMFSFGFVGLALFLTTMWGLAVTTRRVVDLQSVLIHTPLVTVLVMMLFYGIDGVHLTILFTCAALLLRPERWRPGQRQAAAEPPGPEPVEAVPHEAVVPPDAVLTPAGASTVPGFHGIPAARRRFPGGPATGQVPAQTPAQTPERTPEQNGGQQ